MANPMTVLSKGLKSMKVEKKSKEMDKPIDVEQRDEFPWGLRIDLNKDSLKNLGLSTKDFTVGEEISVACMAKVISVRATEGEFNDSKNVELQITKMKLESEEEED